MLIRRGCARDDAADRRLATVLASVAGALNAAVFHAVGFFAANMTGNVSTLSSLIALGNWMHGLGYAAIVLTFIGGATVSTLVIDAGLRRGVDTIYALVVLVEAVLLATLGGLELILPQVQGVPLMILGLSFLMGLQNAIVTHISDARVRTTHVSGMSTDIGIGLARLIAITRGHASDKTRPAVLAKLRLHIQTVGCFLAGGVVGVLLYLAIGNVTLLIAALPLLLVSAPPLFGRHRPIPDSH